MSRIPRRPDMGTKYNDADNIERFLQEDGHRTWGFVIYRCTYDNDDDWNKLMEHLRHHTSKSLEFCNGLDIMDSLSLTVIEDQSILDDASTSFVRMHFKQWAASAPEREQGQGIGPGLSQRYRYCIQVDEAALESIIEDEDDGFVNLIKLEWEPHAPSAREPAKEPIEDCTQHDVGWMMVASKSVMVGMHHYLREYNNWYTEYRRPPTIAHG
jgi:hypothetical protein